MPKPKTNRKHPIHTAGSKGGSARPSSSADTARKLRAICNGAICQAHGLTLVGDREDSPFGKGVLFVNPIGEQGTTASFGTPVFVTMSELRHAISTGDMKLV